MSKKLQMMAFIPKATTIKIYTIGFPARWKELLYKLAITVNPKYDYEKYNLPLCSALGKICANWIYGLIEIKPMRQSSNDAEWVVCLNQIDADMCEEICVNLRAAAYSFYKGRIKDQTGNDALKAFVSAINPEELLKLVGSRELEIINNDGRIADKCAYQGLSLKIMQSLIGKQINYRGKELLLYSSGRGELMSQVLQDSKGQYFAYVFAFSLQTVPPDSQPMLLLHCSRRRFKNTSKSSKNYWPNKLSVYIKHAKDSNYYKLNMESTWNKETRESEVVWSTVDAECYNSIYREGLPSAPDLKRAIEKYNSPQNEPRLFCTISPLNSFAGETKIGTGISALDRGVFYAEIYKHISDSADICSEVDRGKDRNVRMNADKSYADLALRLSKTGYKGLDIEIYSFSMHDGYASIIENILKEKLADVVSEEKFSIRVDRLPLGEYAQPMPKGDYKKYCNREQRILAIAERIGKARSEIMTGAIIVLPRRDDDLRDVKDLLRCGFALSGRVTQFINPDIDEKLSQTKKEDLFAFKSVMSIADLLRQFGYSRTATNISKFNACPIIAIDVVSHIKTIREDMKGETARALPIMLKYDIADGLIMVECPILNNGLPVTYYEACLQFAKLSMDREFADKCNDSLRRYAELKLKALENYYRYNDAIIIVSGDGFMRNELWTGISNKKISEYMTDPKYAECIDIGNTSLSVPFNFSNSKLRIVRIRYNDEVPDYYMQEEEKVTGGSDGIFNCGKVYYGCVTVKKMDKRYRNSDKEYSIDNPTHDYCGKRLIEYYPIVLQTGDNVHKLINYINETRTLSPQYKEATNVPLPLHYLGDRIKEYLSFD